MTEKYNWEYENSINVKDRYIDVTSSSEPKYNAFRTNRSLSNFVDTVMFANEMNMNYGLSAKLQYDFLYNVVRKHNRRFKARGTKTKTDETFDLVQRYYKYSRKKTYETLAVLTDEQLEKIKIKMDTGGIK